MTNQETFTIETSSIFLDASRSSSFHRSCSLMFEDDESNRRNFPPSLSVTTLDIHLVSAQPQCDVSAHTESSSDLLCRNATPDFPACPTLSSQRLHKIDDVNGSKESVITRTGKCLEKLRIFVGFDSREEIAYDVCRHSILRHATIDVEIIPLKLQNLVEQGLYARSRESTESTEFSFTRFLTPFLAGFEGWAVFVDCDFLYTTDVRELAELVDDQFAIMCVKHNYTPKATVKMDGVVQTSYLRKNWSSMVLYNCSHPKNRVLTPELINSESGAFLHRSRCRDRTCARRRPQHNSACFHL
ncbi:protein CDI isoform X2 [Physcomitrium patens]|uniref:Uncharacterized protein n=1 Tax=Physcomitrium patens TaxID=3218 RepID=A0A2K1IVQ2_PHYPA|nr:protein CDI-like isoform X2 [Physcomitrium patens]PNR33354.1 hypothetical protein PHYPA_025297 [Physcomitrium patens]|eukprot:XP_024357627.1 protein CDI-like isoform X2 [Physcomitrella patens]